MQTPQEVFTLLDDSSQTTWTILPGSSLELRLLAQPTNLGVFSTALILGCSSTGINVRVELSIEGCADDMALLGLRPQPRRVLLNANAHLVGSGKRIQSFKGAEDVSSRKTRRIAGSSMLESQQISDPSTPTSYVIGQHTHAPGSVELGTPGLTPPGPGAPAAELNAAFMAAEQAASADHRAVVPELGKIGSGSSSRTADTQPGSSLSWVEKQEAPFTAWLNSVLVPPGLDPTGEGLRALSSRRMTARVRGLLWGLYSQDAELRGTMKKVEQRIEEGKIRIKEEVRGGWQHGEGVAGVWVCAWPQLRWGWGQHQKERNCAGQVGSTDGVHSIMHLCTTCAAGAFF
jgi:hypothetical protein